MMTSVNTILFRRSATLNMFRRLDSTVVLPLDDVSGARWNSAGAGYASLVRGGPRGVIGRRARLPARGPGGARGGRVSSPLYLFANWLPLAGGRRSPQRFGTTSTLPPAA